MAPQNAVVRAKAGGTLLALAAAEGSRVSPQGRGQADEVHTLPPGHSFDVGGQLQQQEAFPGPMAAMAQAAIFIYIVLASQFGSFLQPIAIMASLPLALLVDFANQARKAGATDADALLQAGLIRMRPVVPVLYSCLVRDRRPSRVAGVEPMLMPADRRWLVRSSPASARGRDEPGADFCVARPTSPRSSARRRPPASPTRCSASGP